MPQLNVNVQMYSPGVTTQLRQLQKLNVGAVGVIKNLVMSIGLWARLSGSTHFLQI